MLTADSTPPLKRDVLGRVTLPAAQREALLDEFERSGLMGEVDPVLWPGLREIKL